MADAPDLDKLKADFKKLQDDIAALNKKAAIAESAIKTAEAQLAEVAKATEGYDKSGPQMQHELDDDEKAIAKKRSLAESNIKDLKDAIDKKIAEFDKALAAQGKAAGSAADAAAKARAAADGAMQDLQDKQAAFAALKDNPKAAAAKLKELKGLLNEIAKAEAQDDSVAVYLYVVEAAPWPMTCPSRLRMPTGRSSSTLNRKSRKRRTPPPPRKRISTRPTPLRLAHGKNSRPPSPRAEPIC